MTDFFILLFTAIPSWAFLSEKLHLLIQAAFGFENRAAAYIICGLCLGAVIVSAYKKKWLTYLPGGRAALILFELSGIFLGFRFPAVLDAQTLLSRLGGGMLLGYYLLILVAMCRYIVPHKIDSKALKYLLAVFGIINFAGAVYISQSSFIYYWDNATYWTIARDIAGGSISDSFFSQIYDSILHLDYNYLAGLLSALFSAVFGGSRTVFVLSILNCYFLPAAYLVYTLAKGAKNQTVTAVSALLFCPLILFLGLSGFVDIGGLIFCLLCFKLYFSQKQTIPHFFAIGGLLAICILFRRWYAFFAVSFMIAMLFDCMISKKDIRLAGTAILHTGLILMIFFSSLVTDKLLADYAALYAGYKFSLTVDLKLFARYFGILPAILLLLGSAILLIKKDKRILFAYIQIAVCFFLFTRTQTHGQQHLLLYIPSVLFILLSIIKRFSIRTASTFLILAACITVNTFIPRQQPQSLSEITSYAVIPNFSMLPRIRTDAKDILALKAYIDTLCQDYEKAGILASSFIINKDILQNAEPSFHIVTNNTRDCMVELPAVDSRDKDLSAFYMVDYMIVATPAQTHLAPENQQLIVNAVDSFVNMTDIACAYERLDTNLTVGDVHISVYKKMRQNTEQEIIEFEKKMTFI